MCRYHRDDICNVIRLLVFACRSTVMAMGSDVRDDVSGPCHSNECDFEGGPSIMVVEGAADEVLEIVRRLLRSFTADQEGRVLGYPAVV